MLHGHGMSGEIMKNKLGFLRSETKKSVEWCFIDGPIAMTAEEVRASLAARRAPASPSDGSAAPGDPHNLPTASTPASRPDDERPPSDPIAVGLGDGAAATSVELGDVPPRAAMDRDADADESTRSASAPRLYSWFNFTEHTDDTGHPMYKGLNDTFSKIDEACRRDGPFDGVFGFSQGAVVAAMWIARQHAAFAKTSPPPTHLLSSAGAQSTVDWDAVMVPQRDRLLRFGVFCSGLLPSDPREREFIWSLRGPSAPLATLHCYGETDEVIVPERSEALRSVPLFTTPPAVVAPSETHPGGHAVASQFRKPLKAFFTAQIASKDATAAAAK